MNKSCLIVIWLMASLFVNLLVGGELAIAQDVTVPAATPATQTAALAGSPAASAATPATQTAASAGSAATRAVTGQVEVIAPVRRPRIVLALGGGGARGAAHLGVLRVLEKEGIPVDMIAGTSMGAIVGGLYAAGLSPDQIQTLFFNNTLFHSYMTVPIFIRVLAMPLFGLARLTGRHPYDGFYRGNKFANYLNDAVPDDQIEVSKLKIPFWAVCTNLLDGQPYAIKNGNFGRALQASSAIPVLRRPVPLDNKLLVDGFIVANVPVEQARAMGGDIVVAVSVDESLKALPEEAFRKTGSVSHRIFNLFLTRYDLPRLEKADIVIAPDVDGIGLLSRNKDDARASIAAGEEATRKMIPAIRAKLQSYMAANPAGQK